MQEQSTGSRFGIDPDQRERLMDLGSTVILSIAVVLTAFSAWQSTLWASEQASAYVQGSSLRAQSNAALTQGTTELNYDATAFAIGIVQFFEADEETVAFFRERLFRDEFKPALDAWIATDPLNNPDAPETPFDVPEFENANLDRSRTLADEAEERIQKGDVANRNADNYILATVMFAATLFFTGIVMKMREEKLRLASLGLALVGLVVASGYLLVLPKAFHT